ncbi:MAG TPA: arginine--tRNA ligase [Sediminibacterium sp.]|uniref:arginine--tRNA ligase n=1 Tax=Sediminibacterium sp. TaxID=1917865 RepID=UPI0008AC790C|nr:arginine--tRNA ligase [Sediminibacterium sp.]OHC85262.1 MAG: arginine--tRNA ligase [Sphingobacteriia bacterium RIFOXYC2_FULL_35_18]OHC89165.1 MAG: arginine--tRNA ligase [Sphingobacteriia bacterium RIFOXYD2_FULL_35_12]HLD53543.1 arginine--tRNA ligase [Sediminibacterium sp.]
MSVVNRIKEAAANSIHQLYGTSVKPEQVLVNQTKSEFEGDYTVVLFAFVKELKKSPEQLGQELGTEMVARFPDLFTGYNIVKGFLNLSINAAYWTQFLMNQYNDLQFGHSTTTGNKVMVEYSSPNTNKPLHLGHLRNNFLGRSIAEILKATGNDVVKTCIVNDRGIHICKSMIAWKRYANGATPSSTQMKGDHFVGDYYVKFNDAYKAEIADLKATGLTEEQAEKDAPIMKEAQQMLLDWEAGDPAVMELWKNMNGWVYEGFDATYKRIGTDFDKIYYESNTYLLGKDLVDKGLEEKVFYQKEDNSVWIDLTNDGLDEKLVRRKDGTSVYITQDIGLAEQKQKEFNANQSIYVVGDEQNYHFKVLKLICQKLKLPSADGIDHLSYGMVELPTGKMKSREGTVVDADDLVDEMINIAREKTEELGKVNDFTEEERAELYDTIGLGALKFFLLRVDPKKKMVFNPAESIDFHGFTGPFIQYTYARISSILRKLNYQSSTGLAVDSNETWLPLEKELIVTLEQFPTVLKDAGIEQDPSKVAIYVFNLAKTFSSFYSEHSIANAENHSKQALRIMLSVFTATVIKNGMKVLGIKVPERM